MNRQSIQFNEGINYLRSISIVFVVLYHLGFSWASYGYLGVDAFFVISGFLMGRLYGEIGDKSQAVDFYFRRFRRIAPAYYTVIIIVAIISSYNLLPHEQEIVTISVILSSIFAENFDAWLTSGYFAPHIFRPLLHLWSLSVEFQFYLVFPIALWVKRRNHRAFAALVFFSFFLFVSFHVVSQKTGFLFLVHAFGNLAWDF